MSACVPCMLVGADRPPLSDRFFDLLADMGARRQTDPEHYLVVWCAESGLDASIINGIGARGLNQMMPQTLAGIGAPAGFEHLSPEEQLPWIERLIAMREPLNGGPFLSAARYYHSNFYPATMVRGDAPTAVVVASDAANPHERAAYSANRGLDTDGDGRITLQDLADRLADVRATRCATAFVRLRQAVAARRYPAPPRQSDPEPIAERPRTSHFAAMVGFAALIGSVALIRGRS